MNEKVEIHWMVKRAIELTFPREAEVILQELKYSETQDLWYFNSSGVMVFIDECGDITTDAVIDADDYETCGDCGFDHSYEPNEAAQWHKANPCSYCNYDKKNHEHADDCLL